MSHDKSSYSVTESVAQNVLSDVILNSYPCTGLEWLLRTRHRALYNSIMRESVNRSQMEVKWT
jgi:hypothetical protein